MVYVLVLRIATSMSKKHDDNDDNREQTARCTIVNQSLKHGAQ